MSCGFKKDGLIFRTKEELRLYVDHGVVPKGNNEQSVKNEALKTVLAEPGRGSVVGAISMLYNPTSSERISIEKEGGLVNVAESFYDFVNTGKGVKNPLYEKFYETISLINNNSGVVSDAISNTTENGKRIFKNATISTNRPGQGVSENQKEFWHISEENKERKTGDQISGARNAISNNNARSSKGRGSQERDSREVEANSVISGGSYQGHAERIQIPNGQFVGWNPTTRKWDRIVRDNGGNRWGHVRKANESEARIAEMQHQKMLFDETAFTSPDIKDVKPSFDKTPFEVQNALIEYGNMDELLDADDLFYVNGNAFFEIVAVDNGLTIVRPSKKEKGILKITKPLYEGTVDYENRVYDYRGVGSMMNHFFRGHDAVVMKDGRIYVQDNSFLIESELPSYFTEKYYEDPVIREKIDDVLSLYDYSTTSEISRKDGAYFFEKGDHFVTVVYEGVKRMEDAPDWVKREAEILDSEMPDMSLDKRLMLFRDVIKEMAIAGADILSVNTKNSEFYEKVGFEKKGDYYFFDLRPTKENLPKVEEIDAETEESNRLEVLRNMIFNNKGDVFGNLRNAYMAGYIDMDLDSLYKLFYNDFVQAGYDTLDYIPTDLENKFDVIDKNGGFDSEFPPNVSDPVMFFTNIGFVGEMAKIAEYIYNKIPPFYNKTKKATQILLAMFYPDKKFQVFDHIPFSKEDMLALENKYKDVDGKIGNILLKEMAEENVGQYFNRSLDFFDSLLKEIKSYDMDLPIPYRAYFNRIREKDPIFEEGEVLIKDGRRYVVYNIIYKKDGDHEYIIQDEKTGAFSQVDGLGIGEYGESFEDMSHLKRVSSVLKDIDVKVKGMLPSFFKGDANAFYDIPSKTVYVTSNKLSDSRILYHEAVHALFIKKLVLDKNTITDLHNKIFTSLMLGSESERALAEEINQVLKEYDEKDAQNASMALDEMLAHEFFAVLGAKMAMSEISLPVRQSLFQKIRNWLMKILGLKNEYDISDIYDFTRFLNSVAEHLRTGEGVSFDKYRNMFTGDKIASVSGRLLSKDVGIDKRILAGQKYFVNEGGKIQSKTVEVVGQVEGNYFIKFENDPMTYSSREVVISNVKNSDKIVLNISPSVNIRRDAQSVTISDDLREEMAEYFNLRKEDGTYEYRIPEIYAIFEKELKGYSYNDFRTIANAYRQPDPTSAQPGAVPVPATIPNPVAVPNPVVVPDVVFPSSAPASRVDVNGEIKSIVDRINNMDIDQNAVLHFIKTGETKEHLVAATESYISGESIEGHTGFAPTANQTYHRFQIAKGAEIGTQILKDLKRVFGLDYVEKTVDMLNAYGVSIVGKTIVFGTLERDLVYRRRTEPDNVKELIYLQKYVHSSSQASIRNASVALNARKIAYDMLQTQITPSEVAERIMPKRYTDNKRAVEKALDEDVSDVVEKGPEFRESKRKERTPVRKTSDAHKENITSKIKPERVINELYSQVRALINKIC